ncbi:hypothetical protein MMYC01_210617 [Madurella mycetomatis]|uniref:Uncharacterized protein n=1 Tax=Madurella mycetomatis TaxID=100816 RepID=A0A175VMW3_9PEZI|nr:hypothetical protein MMYC01_210617 [Madurella mycetomatis]
MPPVSWHIKTAALMDPRREPSRRENGGRRLLRLQKTEGELGLATAASVPRYRPARSVAVLWHLTQLGGRRLRSIARLPMEPQGTGPNSMPLGAGTLNHNFNNPLYSVPGNGGQASVASAQPPAYPTGSQQATTFSQQLPPVMAPQQPFAVPSNIANGPPGAVGGESMLQ